MGVEEGMARSIPFPIVRSRPRTAQHGENVMEGDYNIETSEFDSISSRALSSATQSNMRIIRQFVNDLEHIRTERETCLCNQFSANKSQTES